MFLCFALANELLLYMYLSQFMSTVTQLSESALSSQWFLHPESQGTSDPTITPVFTYTQVGHSRIHRGDHIPVIFVHSCNFPVAWAYPNVNQHFSSISQSICLSVCLTCFDLAFNTGIDCTGFSLGYENTCGCMCYHYALGEQLILHLECHWDPDLHNF